MILSVVSLNIWYVFFPLLLALFIASVASLNKSLLLVAAPYVKDSFKLMEMLFI